MKSNSSPFSESARGTPRVQEISLDQLPDDQLVDTPQTSVLLHTAEGTLAIWCCTGRYHLPFVKIGHKVFYRAGDLKAFIKRRTRQHTGEVA